MSYTSNVGGKIVVTAKGNIKSYAKEDIAINSAKTIKVTGVKKGVSFNKPKMFPIYINDKCLVSFRPKDNWNGENYGFDWVRVGDTKIKGDTYYKNIIGNYGSIYASQGGTLTQSDAEFKRLMTKFDPHKFFVKDKTSKKKAVNYCVPWLCLYPQNTIKQVKQKDGTIKATEVKTSYKNVTAVLRTIVKIDKKPEKLELDYDKTLFKITSPVIPLAIGTHEIEMTITCLKEFDKDQPIKVIATYKNAKGELEKSLAGKLNVLRNKIRYEAKVLFVNVRCKIDNVEKTANPIGRDVELKKYLNQGLTNPIITKVSLDLSKNTDPVTKKVTNKKRDFNIALGVTAKTIPDGTLDSTYIYLNKELKSKFGNKYNDYFKLYFIPEDSGNVAGIGRNMDDNTRTVIVYKSGFTDSTVAHEALHSMGLYHSFDNDGDFTFEIYKTDNIMDYSDIGTVPIPVISLYHWQWARVWSRI
jgi:hypothetical protein